MFPPSLVTVVGGGDEVVAARLHAGIRVEKSRAFFFFPLSPPPLFSAHLFLCLAGRRDVEAGEKRERMY